VSNGLNRLSVYLFWHNYRKPWRVKTARILEPCHAIVAGADEGMLSAAGIRRLKRRSFLSQLDLGAAMLRTWMKAWETPLRGSVNYLPAYAVKCKGRRTSFVTVTKKTGHCSAVTGLSWR
jgi:hypothetical protein